MWIIVCIIVINLKIFGNSMNEKNEKVIDIGNIEIIVSAVDINNGYGIISELG